MDYIIGVLLIILPWIVGFAHYGAETWVPVILGAGVLCYSALTSYEWGLLRVIPMPVHLWLDGAGGLFLAISPWLFGFAHLVWLPHLIIGLFEIGTALFTERVPSLSWRIGWSSGLGPFGR